MEFKVEPYIIYVKINSNNYIISINSSAFLKDITDWIEIDSGYGDKYHHAQNNYFSKYLMTESGVYRYKLVDGSPIECTEEEIAAQEALLPKPEQTQDSTLSVYDELETAYQEGVNSI